VSRRAVLAGAVLLAIGRGGLVAWAEQSEVGIDNFVFTPREITVPKGGTLTWVNRDDIPHSVVFIGLVRSPVLDTDQSWSHRFDRAGRFAYICGLHPHMHGIVVVE
jgi:plastocyanin